MTSWMLRGLVFAGGMVLVRLVQGALINTYENKASMISLTLVALFGIAPIVWGFLDGRSDAKDNWDPDRRRDLAMRWLNAGPFAGVVSGAVAWIISCSTRTSTPTTCSTSSPPSRRSQLCWCSSPLSSRWPSAGCPSTGAARDAPPSRHR